MNLAGLIDHTLLKPEATEQEIIKLCQEARQYQFASVCVHPIWVKTCAKELHDTGVQVCTVIGFPLGANKPEVKAFETSQAVADGATEVDMVIHIGALKSGNDELVLRDITAVLEATQGKALVKVIIETALLNQEEKVKACKLSQQAGADFVKTSTGFSTGGASIEDVVLMRQTVGTSMGVKASGGIRDKKTCLQLYAAGANRIGTSSGVAIVSQK